MGDQTTQTSSSEAGLDPIRILEAALFMSSKPLSLSELARVSGIAAPGFVEGQMKKLQEEYTRSGSALVITCEAGKYLMRLRPEYERRVGTLAGEADVSAGAARILGLVSKNEGIEQSKLVRMLGSTVYDYVGELVEKEFLTAERKGRTRALRTTQRFRDYFTL